MSLPGVASAAKRWGAGAAVLVTAAMAVIGRLGLGLFVDRLDQRRLAAFLLAAQAGVPFVMLQSSCNLARPVLVGDQDEPTGRFRT